MRAAIVGLAVAGLAPMLATETAAAAQSAPTCTPSTLNTPATLDGTVTVSPLPGSRDASPQTQISFLGVPAAELHGVSVVGSRTGGHAGRLLAYSQGDGASFLPARGFAEGERVTVRARLHAGAAVRQLFDQFAIAHEDPISTTPETIHPGGPSEIQSFRSRPDLRPPAVTVTVRSPAATPGEEFLAPYTGPGQAGPMILDQSGGLVWFKALPEHTSATNFSVQAYEGKPALTWWQGNISVHGFGQGEDTIADATYTDIAHVKAGNGVQADLHDFQLTPQGTALITAYDPILCDLSSIGAPAYGGVTDGLLQEIDVKTGLVMFQWTSLDHVALSESYTPAKTTSPAWPFDFFHINSIALQRSGNLLISARNTWTTYDVNRQTGQILWRLGGKRSSFAMGSGTGTAWQHDPRELPNGSISVFDNGAGPAVHRQSRGIVVSLDPRRKTATLVGQILHPPPLLAESQGNMQALANGDWFLGWGQVPDFSELSSTGQLLLDAHFPAHTQSYRAFSFVWTGTPAHQPTLALQPAPGGGGVAYASWNGATLVASWRVLAGPSAASLQPLTQAARAGFETAIPLPAGASGPYFAVQALDGSGVVLGVSAAQGPPR
jgi:hypothetical protein